MPVSPAPQIDLAVMSVDPRRPWNANASVGVANRCQATAFQVRRPVTVSQATLHVGTQNGNISVGILRGDDISALTRIATTGAVAAPAAGVATIAFTSSVTLVPGVRYWGAVSADNTTFGAYITHTAVASGVMGAIKVSGGMASAHPVPETVTLENTGSTDRPYFLVFS